MVKREISKLFEDDDRERLWGHLATLTNLAEGKVAEIKGRPIERMDPYLVEKWQRVVGALSNASKIIGNI